MDIVDITPKVVMDLFKALDCLGFNSTEVAAKAFLAERNDSTRFDIDDLNIDEQTVLLDWRMKTRQMLQYRD